VVTHPKVFTPPVPLAVALHDLDQIMASPTLVMLSETQRHSEVMRTVIRESGVTGNLIFDARIAALCIEHGISELITGDRDFSRLPVRISNPFQ
jgi:predicted nucleic acid-binding protein